MTVPPSGSQAETEKREDVFVTVKGECPMGCGSTLFLGDGGHVTCSYRPCPNPAAADEMLRDSSGRLAAAGVAEALARDAGERFGYTLGTGRLFCDCGAETAGQG